MIEHCSRKIAQRLYDGTRCTICGELFQVGDSITEIKGTLVWSALGPERDMEIIVRYHPCCMEEVHVQ